MDRIPFYILICSIFLISCSDFDDEWRNDEFKGRQFNNLVVVGMSHELERGKIYEEVGVEELLKYGIAAEKGLTIFPQIITEQEHNNDTITKLIVASKVDAVLMIKVLHEDDHTYMMPDEHKRFKAFYGRWGRSKSVSGAYYKRPEKYYMIATLYDLHEKHEENEETVVWRAVNLITNPAAKIKRKKEFIRTAIEHLIDQELLITSQ